MRFATLADAYEQLESISSGTQMRAVLAKLFRQTPKTDIKQVAYLTLGQIASPYEPVDIGMAEKMVLRAIAQSSGKESGEISSAYKRLGDVGIVAQQFVGRARKVLSVAEVFSTLHAIAQTAGAGSQDRKTALLGKLLSNASSKEARFLARIVTGTLRLGVGDKTVLDALSIAFTGSKEARKELERAYNICPDAGIIAELVATKGIAGVKRIGVTLGRPIQMMLAQRVKSMGEVENKLGMPVAVEEKYDGERIQAHKDCNKVTLFSRRLENITTQFPDIVAATLSAVKAKTAVLEGEAVPVDAKGNLLPFQVLMQRRRKHGVEEYSRKIPLRLFVFDLLYLNGKTLLDSPYPKRHESLKRIIGKSGTISLASREACNDLECAEEFFNKALQRGGEGIMAKSLRQDSTYQAGVRGWHWIKWKPEYAEELRDTVDLAVVGAFYGRGMRAGTYGALLCAAYNEKLDRFETFCKLGSGFTDVQLAGLPKMFKPYAVSRQPARVVVTKAMTPDVWFEPKLVVEVVGAEITRSPTHTTAIEHGQGLALRFPRLVRFRDDKKPEQATTTREILSMAGKRL